VSAYHRTSAALIRAQKARALVVLPTACARCGGVIDVGEPFDMGHAIGVAQGGQDSELRPEHRLCNRRAGGRVGGHNKAARAKREARPRW